MGILTSAERIHLSTITLGELEAGFLLGSRVEENRRALRPLLEDSGALDYARQHAQRHSSHALTALEVLPDSSAKNVLRTMAQYVMRRTS